MSIAQNLASVLDDIRRAEADAKREPNSVRLVAVSKFHSADAVAEAVAAGQVLFGENRVQEATAKFGDLAARALPFELHIIGTLQRNKVRDAVRIARCIQSVDRLEVLQEIERQCAKIGKTIDVLFEVRTGEETKAGFTDYAALDHVAALCAQGQFPHVTPRGLMTMAPNTDDHDRIRAAFRETRGVRDALAEKYTSLHLAELSMGMSGDFRIAISEGATMVRIGTAIFGARQA
ncbi:MAG: YggS family pyridoxal phosphate-dependent enzyme [Treponema sp.]|nr:YggS family pyridoxal phosphate-dependent enzyme [Treponema sp.]